MPFMRILFSTKTPVVATRKGSGARTLKRGLETGFLTLLMKAWAASLLGESPGQSTPRAVTPCLLMAAGASVFVHSRAQSSEVTAPLGHHGRSDNAKVVVFVACAGF